MSQQSGRRYPDLTGWTDEEVEVAREAAWQETRRLCRLPADESPADMCARDSDAIAFAVLRATAKTGTETRDA